MKNNLFKKSMSVFLSVLMLLSCWVFVPGEHNHAEALLGTYYGKPEINGYHYNQGTTNAYGTPVFDGTLDRWFKWANTSSGDWTTVYYPSHIYLDKSESLQSAGYYFNVKWHFGSGASYRILLGANVWGDNTAWDSYGDGRIRTMNNIFSNYAVDASCTDTYYTAGDGGLYSSGASNYDLRIVGYGYSSQGTDGFNQNGIRHDKYVLFRSRASENNATIYLKGNPSASYVGKTTEYNTSGGSFGSYGLAQQYGNNNTWSNHSNGCAQFNSKGSESSYMEGQWIEMAWNVTIYDKSALNTAINTADGMVNNTMYSRVYREKLSAAISNARTVLTKRVTNQTEIDNARNTLQNLINAPEYRTYEITYENLFSLSDWWNSNSAINGGKRTVTVDLAAGKVIVDNAETTEGKEVVTNHSGDASSIGTRNTAYYAIPVTAGKSYTIKYSTDHNNTEMFAFFYDVNGGCTHSGNFGAYNFAAPQNGTGTATFTAPANSTQMEIRFDNNSSTTTAHYWDIMVYEADRANDVELDTWTTRPIRKLYNYNDTFRLSELTTPARPGYKFDGWYLDAAYTNPYSNFDNTYTFTPANGAASFPAYAKWSKKTLDINYDNLFSFSDWYYSNSNGVNDSAIGTMTADVEKGTITFTATANDFFSPNNGAAGYYTATVKPDTTYVLSYDLELASGGMQVGAWYYTDSLAASGVKGYDISYNEADGYYEFTTPSDCTKVAIRFGVTGNDGKGTYSNIGIYEKADYEDYADSYSKVREPFKVGDTTDLMVPSRDGYVFNGWEKADGTKIEDVTGLTASETVYATWVKEWKVTFLNGDGSDLGISTVKDGEAAKAPVATPVKESDAGYHYAFESWDKDFSSVTEDMTVSPNFTATVHEAAYIFVSDSTCYRNALVKKYCSDCGYVFFEEGEYDGTEKTDWLKTDNHNYQLVKNQDYTDSYHTLKCSNAGCTITTTAAHSLDEGTASGGDCTTPTTITKRCACGYAKNEEGTALGHKWNAADCDTPKTCSVCGETEGTALGHNWNAADCDTPKTCSVCGETEGTALGHNMQLTSEKVDPKCEVEGKEAVYTCANGCGKTEGGEAIPALSHKYTTYIYNDDATCLANGTKTATCDNGCGKEDTVVAEGTKRTHIFEGTIKNEGNGTHSYECTYDDCNVYGGTVACSNWKEDATNKKCECEDCGYTKDHVWGKWQKNNDNTGDAAGKMTRECADCKATEETNCTYTSTTTDATCTTDAYTTYTCTVCGHGYTVIDTGTATGHDFSNKDNIVSYNNGTHAYACANYDCSVEGVGETVGATEACAYEYTNVAEKKHKAECDCGYNFTENCSGGTATCTAKAICEKCNSAYGATTDHKFDGAVKVLDGDVHAKLCEYCNRADIYGIGNEVNKTEACSGGTATCTDLAECTVCGDTYGEVNADAHKWSEAVTDTANARKHIYTCEHNEDHTKSGDCKCASPTVVPSDCEASGYQQNYCDECGYGWQTDFTDPLDHEWGAWVDNGDGTHTRTCERAGCAYGENGAAKKQTAACTKDNAKSVVTAPTCTADGYTTYTCNDCGHVWTDDETDATGHTWVDTKTFLKSEADCLNDAVYYQECSVCNISAENDTTSTGTTWTDTDTALDHSFTEAIEDEAHRHTAADCITDAVYYYGCSRCDVISTSEADTWKDTDSKLGHDWTNTEKFNHTPSDCITDAVYYKECSRCHISSEGETDEIWTKENSKSGHDLTHHEAVAADCDDNGFIEYWSCSKCGKNFKDEDAKIATTDLTTSPLGHDWIYVAYKAANCEEDGHSAHQKCSRCDEKNSDYKEYGKTGHNFTGAYYSDKTNHYHAMYCVNNDCTEYGIGIGEDAVKYSVEYEGLDYVISGGIKCEFTGEYVNYVDEDGNHSHKLVCVCGNETSELCADATPERIPAKCGVNAFDKHICEVCNYEWLVEIEGTAIEHSFSQWTSNGNDTHTRECLNGCGETETEDCATVDAPATECGKQNVCDKCKTAFGTQIPHTWEETETYLKSENNCTDGAVYYLECSKCHSSSETLTGKTWTKDNATGHSMITDYVYDVSAWTYKPADFDKEIKVPTCKDEGLGIIYCENCSYYKTKTVKADSEAHVWGDWEEIGGDCLTGIVFTSICEVCGAKQSKLEESSDHTWETVAVVAPTCEEAGYTEQVCSVCQATQKLVGDDAKGHNWKLTVTKEPTCATTGRGENTCANCGVVESVKLAARIHVWDADADGITDSDFDAEEYLAGLNGAAPQFIFVEATEATCDMVGYNAYYKCLDCSYDQHRDERWLAVSGNYKAPTGHADNDGDGKCDSCKDTIYSGDKVCGCICHEQNWFLKIIYKIFNFFWKLFRIKPTCKCGHVHY